MFSPKKITLALILMVVWSFSACISLHPLGMSDAEWDALSPAQKMEAREKQAQLRSQKKQDQTDRKAAEQSAIAKRYETAKYGDIITVSITGGTMEIHGKRREYEPIAFDLIKGESKEIEIIRKGKSYSKDTAVVRLSDDGRTFYFDDKQRNKLILVDEGWERGKVYKIKELRNKNADPQNIKIRISYRHVGNDRGDRIIIIR